MAIVTFIFGDLSLVGSWNYDLRSHKVNQHHWEIRDRLMKVNMYKSNDPKLLSNLSSSVVIFKSLKYVIIVRAQRLSTTFWIHVTVKFWIDTSYCYISINMDHPKSVLLIFFTIQTRPTQSDQSITHTQWIFYRAYLYVTNLLKCCTQPQVD